VPGNFKQPKENTMNRSIALGLAMLAGGAIGATAVNGLHAQAKPSVYYISAIDVTNPVTGRSTHRRLMR
jgi:hypothetical protein